MCYWIDGVIEVSCGGGCVYCVVLKVLWNFNIWMVVDDGDEVSLFDCI